MGKSLPIFNGPSFAGALGSLPQQLTQFFTPRPPGEGPYDGRTVDDFKPYLVALNLTKRCNLKCDHCYLDATTKAAGGDDELTTDECFRLIDQIAEKADLPKVKAQEVFETFLDVIKTSLKKGEDVKLVGFGTFTVSERAATTGRNPRTGEAINIAASKQPKFKAGKELKDAVNK